MITQTTDYALRALVHLAREGKMIFARDIARVLGIPAAFAPKILQDLVRRGYLRSMKGPTGGFRLAVQPAEITIADVVLNLQGVRPSSAFIGKKAIEAMNHYQIHTTIADLVKKGAAA